MRILVISILAFFLFMQSCRLKDACEANHTGNVCVKNSTKSDIQVFIDGKEEFTLKSSETQCITKPTGAHYIRCWQGNIEILETTDIKVEECETTEVTVVLD